MEQKEELLNDVKNLAKLTEEEDFEVAKNLTIKKWKTFQTFSNISRKNIYMTERKIEGFRIQFQGWQEVMETRKALTIDTKENLWTIIDFLSTNLFRSSSKPYRTYLKNTTL